MVEEIKYTVLNPLTQRLDCFAPRLVAVFTSDGGASMILCRTVHSKAGLLKPFAKQPMELERRTTVYDEAQAR